MKSAIVKRSIVLGGHKTSVSLEDAFWSALKEIAGSSKTTLSNLVNAIDHQRSDGNLSSAIRMFVLHHFRSEHLVSHRPDMPALASPARYIGTAAAFEAPHVAGNMPSRS